MTRQQLKSYFERIHIPPPESMDEKILSEILLNHTRHIPFENLNPFLGIPVKTDPENIFKKLITDRRGGYCFEQNILLKTILKELGIEAEPLAARVHTSSDSMNARTHMLLLVPLNNKIYLCDSGFGGMTPPAPLVFEEEKIHTVPLNTYKISKLGELYTLNILKDNEWADLYSFDRQKQFPVDFKMANWYTSMHPDSHFTKQLSVARTGEGVRYNLRNNHFSVLYESGETERKALENPDEIKEVLEGIFHLNLTNLPGLDQKLVTIIAS